MARYATSALAFAAILVACPGPEPHLRPGAGGATTASHGGAGGGVGGMGGSGGDGHGGADPCDRDEVEACGTCFRPLRQIAARVTLSGVLDWDGDGDRDIVGLAPGGIFNVLFAESGGVFGSAMPFPPPINFGRSARFTDDDFPDSIVIQQMQNIGYRENLAGSALGGIVPVDTQTGPRAFVTGDINGDGIHDAVLLRCELDNCMINPVSLPVYIATGIGGTTPFVTPAPTVTAHPTVVGVLAMVTNDAFADLVTLNWDDDELQVYINTSGSLSATPMTVPISPPGMGPSGVSVMDIDGVGGPELAITHGGAASDVSIMTSTTSGDISAYTFVPVEGGQSSPTLVDLDGGGYVDLVVSVTLPGDMNQITVACGNETGFDAPQVIADDPSLGKYVIVEDIDGDGARDIAARTMGGFALILASP